MPRSYYDLDDILAEEELLPCSTLFDFHYLAHLDPEIDEKQNKLPEGSRIKIPLWAVEKWANLGFVRVSLPRHFSRKARERLEAEPSEVDLRKRNDRFFLSGRMLVELIEKSSKKVAKAISSQTGRTNPRRNAQIAALEAVTKEALELRKSLLSAYTGDRLRHTLDWALSSVGEDVSSYTDKLTEMERRLFQRGAMAASNHSRWKLNGNRRLVIAHSASDRGSTSADASNTADEHRDKRQRQH